ncbi:hypothetical protein A79_0873 [Vibrio parahaemolyticus AQ3810]|nr:hypothetical protein A79_5764 [Vibrio parahaemolyticus AQ3810]EDM61169.1 hypothetical protein A79_0873 [Vibrio parahaemolyticus AQ3810]
MLLQGTSTQKPTHIKNAMRAESLLNCLLGFFHQVLFTL